MRTLSILISLVFLVLAACDNAPKNPIAEQGDRMIRAYDRSKVVRDEASIVSIRTAVQAYYAANGKYPDNLSDVEDLIGSPVDFSKYDYNPQNGSVTLKGQ